jgi:hypothetical protein
MTSCARLVRELAHCGFDRACVGSTSGRATAGDTSLVLAWNLHKYCQKTLAFLAFRRDISRPRVTAADSGFCSPIAEQG